MTLMFASDGALPAPTSTFVMPSSGALLPVFLALDWATRYFISNAIGKMLFVGKGGMLLMHLALISMAPTCGGAGTIFLDEGNAFSFFCSMIFLAEFHQDQFIFWGAQMLSFATFHQQIIPEMLWWGAFFWTLTSGLWALKQRLCMGTQHGVVSTHHGCAICRSHTTVIGSHCG